MKRNLNCCAFLVLKSVHVQSFSPQCLKQICQSLGYKSQAQNYRIPPEERKNILDYDFSISHSLKVDFCGDSQNDLINYNSSHNIEDWCLADICRYRSIHKRYLCNNYRTQGNWTLSFTFKKGRNQNWYNQKESFHYDENLNDWQIVYTTINKLDGAWNETAWVADNDYNWNDDNNEYPNKSNSKLNSVNDIKESFKDHWKNDYSWKDKHKEWQVDNVDELGNVHNDPARDDDDDIVWYDSHTNRWNHSHWKDDNDYISHDDDNEGRSNNNERDNAFEDNDEHNRSEDHRFDDYDDQWYDEYRWRDDDDWEINDGTIDNIHDDWKVSTSDDELDYRKEAWHQNKGNSKSRDDIHDNDEFKWNNDHREDDDEQNNEWKEENDLRNENIDDSTNWIYYDDNAWNDDWNDWWNHEYDDWQRDDDVIENEWNNSTYAWTDDDHGPSTDDYEYKFKEGKPVRSTNVPSLFPYNLDSSSPSTSNRQSTIATKMPSFPPTIKNHGSNQPSMKPSYDFGFDDDFSFESAAQLIHMKNIAIILQLLTFAALIVL